MLYTIGGLLVPAAPRRPSAAGPGRAAAGSSGYACRATSDANRRRTRLAGWPPPGLAASPTGWPQPDGASAGRPRRRSSESPAGPGRVTGSPGWLEVRLPLSAVDLTIRRAGLDIDPGWLPWLGAVVRYVYA